jgi:DnaJ-class molecular chaperone
MKLFRSEEHVHNWSGFKAGSDEGILHLDEVMPIFSGGLFRRRLDSDYVSRIHLYYEEVRKAFEEAAKGRTYWLIPKPYFICPDCGYTAYGEAPETCQFCGTTGDKFKRVD